MDLSTPLGVRVVFNRPHGGLHNFLDLPVVYNGSHYIMVTYHYPMGRCSGFPNISDLPVVYNGSYYIMVTYRYPMGGCSSFPQYLGPSGGVVPQPLGRHVGL